MTARVPLAKMHGTLNDFLVVDGRTTPLHGLLEFARMQCERRAGVGADGVIYIESSETADAKMRTINADGSEAEMCGNGARCAARFLCETDGFESRVFETLAGPIATQVLSKGFEFQVRLCAGVPDFQERALPLQSATFVSMGNPHVILFETEGKPLDLPSVAEEVQRLAAFREGANVHAARLERDGGLAVRHWERGVGVTFSCGTGAVAAAAVAIRNGLARSPVRVGVPGGTLVVEWDGSGPSYLTGPTVRVFDTTVEVYRATV